MQNSKKNYVGKINSEISKIVVDIIDVGIIFLTIHLIKKIKNKKDYDYEDGYTIDDILKFEIEEDILVEPVDTKKLSEGEYGKIFKNFYKKLKSIYPEEDLVNLENNIHETEIVFKKNLLKKIAAFFHDYEISANYDFKNKRISVFNEFESGSVYHELYHMASHRVSETSYLCGLSQSLKGKKREVIGDGINEGYTELLSKRYFKNRKDDSSDTYYYLEEIAEKIELIIGEKTMSHCYLVSDLYSFIMELSKYSSVDATLSFISSTDYVLDYEVEEHHTVASKNRLEENLRYINEYIIKSYVRKLSIEYNDQDVSCKKEILYKIRWILDAVKNYANLDEKYEEILSIDDIKQFIQDAFLEDKEDFEKKRTKIK